MENRRKTIVINKKFQYQYALLVAALAVILVNGFLLFRLLFPGDQPLALDFQAVLLLALVELTLVGGIWYGSLKLSHRIAGPVYVFTREIARLGNGDLTARIQLRDTDMFLEEAQAMNDSIAALSERLARIRDLWTQLQQAGGEGSENNRLTEQLGAELANIKT